MYYPKIDLLNFSKSDEIYCAFVYGLLLQYELLLEQCILYGFEI